MTSLGIDDGKAVSVKQTALNNSSIAEKLIAGHAISGCDTVPQLVGIGKMTMLKVLKMNEYTLNHLGNPNSSMDDIIIESKSFIGALYGEFKQTDMTTAR